MLLADDSPLILRLLEKEFSAAGIAVVTAKDGLEAVEKALAEDVSLVVLDVTMPRMNGYQACRLLKNEPLTRHLPVVILTSRDQAGDRYWGQETGADYYVTKDADAAGIVDLVRQVVAQQAGAPRPKPDRAARTSVDILSRMNELLDRKLYEATVLSEIGRVARNLVHFDETFASVMGLVGRVVEFSVGGMAFVSEDAVEVMVAQPRRLPAAALERAKDALEAVLARERGSDPPPVQLRLFPVADGAAEETTLGGFAAFPVVSGQRLAAALFVGGQAVSRLSPENEQFLHHVANLAHMVLANSRMFAQVQNLSVRDSLTGLYNHRHTMELLSGEVERVGRYPQDFSVLLVDIDHFKAVNDRHGHLAGDAVLREVTQVLQSALRTVDALGRYGGEEFLAILPHTSYEQALQTAERLRRAVAEGVFQAHGQTVPITVSIGVASYPSTDAATPADLVGASDRALYRAKAAGRNRVA